MDDVQRSIGELVQTVTRMFYDPAHVVIMDIMLHHLVLTEEDLADKMKLLPREFNKLAVKLRDDKLLSSETISEMKEDERQVTTTKFFLDFRAIRDIVKYKIYTMTQRLEKKLRENEGSFRFGCKSCGTSYSALDAQSYLSTKDYTFRCPGCSEELKEKKEKNAEEIEGVSEVFSTMMCEISPVIQKLKEIDALGIPEMLRGKIILSQPVQDKPREVAEEKAPEMDYLVDISPSEEEAESEEKRPAEVWKKSEAEKEKHAEVIEEILMVEGAPKKYSEITESDKERMTEKEYERYFEVFEKYQ